MPAGSIQLDGAASILFIGNSYTFGRVDPVMHYNAANVRDLTAPSNGGTFTNTTGSNPYESHPWGGVPGVFKQFTVEAGLTYDVALSARNAATLQGHYLNSNPAGWDLRGNLASQSWDTVVLQDNSTQALPSGAGSVTFAAGSATARLTLTPTADAKMETDETVGLALAAGTGYRVGTTSTITGTILNDDPTGPTVNPSLSTVTLTADPSTVLENAAGGKLVYTFTRTGPTTAPLTINFAATRDGATSPSVATTGAGDFQTQGSSIYKFESGGGTTTGSVSFTSNIGSVTIAAGATTATLTLLPQGDTTVENDESIRFKLSANAAYNVGTQGDVAVTILNDDFAPGTDTSLPNITLNLSKNAVYEDGTDKLVYEFSRTGSTAAALTVNFGINGTATLPSNDFTVNGATSFSTGGASDPDLASFQTYAVKLAQYARTGASDGAVPANTHANAAADIYLYETWARPNLVTGARVATTDDTTGAITTTTTTAPEYYTSLEAMTADLRSAYEGLAASNPIFKGVAPVGAAFLSAVQNGTAIRDPYTTPPGTDGKVDLWWDDNLHASKYGSYLSALTLFGTITGIDPRSLGSADRVAADLVIDPSVSAALQAVAAATVGFSLDARWTAPGQVTELQDATTGLLASAGAFTFADTNSLNVHTVAVSAVTPGALGTLTASLRSDTTGDGSGGAVNWTYTVDDSAVEYLGAGETKVERFLITVSDQNGGTAQREIVVTINGTYDTPPPTSTSPSAGPDQLTATGGDAILAGGTGNDTITGADGNDLLYGNQDNDVIDAGSGNNTAYGGMGDDSVTAGAGNDLLFGNEGSDTINAGDGNNTIVGGQDSTDGADLITAGGGNDLIISNGGNDSVAAGAGNDSVVGGFGDDILFGNQGNDIVLGNQGNELIFGGFGDDTLVGGMGNDTLVGNEGNDVLYGNEGADRLVFGANSGNDIVSGFSSNEGDRLDLQGQSYVVTQDAGNNAVLTLSGGGMITLTGIAANQVGAGFFT